MLEIQSLFVENRLTHNYVIFVLLLNTLPLRNQTAALTCISSINIVRKKKLNDDSLWQNIDIGPQLLKLFYKCNKVRIFLDRPKKLFNFENHE